MTVQRTLAYVLGAAAAGGALYLGISRTGRPPEPRMRRRTSDPGSTLVRVTENGRKYHRDSCPLLHGETRVITVSDALESYEPCKACHPPGDVDIEQARAADIPSSSAGPSGVDEAIAASEEAEERGAPVAAHAERTT